jgi:hypothetical protein
VAERNKQVTINVVYAKDAIGTQWPLAFHGVPGPSAWAKPLVVHHSDFESLAVAG